MIFSIWVFFKAWKVWTFLDVETGEAIALGFQHYILALGTAVMIPSFLVPLMGGTDVSSFSKWISYIFYLSLWPFDECGSCVTWLIRVTKWEWYRLCSLLKELILFYRHCLEPDYQQWSEGLMHLWSQLYQSFMILHWKLLRILIL